MGGDKQIRDHRLRAAYFLSDPRQAPPLELRAYPTLEEVEQADPRLIEFWYLWLAPPLKNQLLIFSKIRKYMGIKEP